MQDISLAAYQTWLARLAIVLACLGSISFLSTCHGGARPRQALFNQPPFSVSVVPGAGGIAMAKNNVREFYVILTNISKDPQSVWEDWNSWGYYAISFELTTADGKYFVLSKKQAGFTKNFPSTFTIDPGEHQVYPVKLDQWWETHPALPKTDEMPITLKAVYEISPTPEATHYKVWTGRIESHNYKFVLRQW
jgi:hypothetical protein